MRTQVGQIQIVAHKITQFDGRLVNGDSDLKIGHYGRECDRLRLNGHVAHRSLHSALHGVRARRQIIARLNLVSPLDRPFSAVDLPFDNARNRIVVYGPRAAALYKDQSPRKRIAHGPRPLASVVVAN